MKVLARGVHKGLSLRNPRRFARRSRKERTLFAHLDHPPIVHQTQAQPFELGLGDVVVEDRVQPVCVRVRELVAEDQLGDTE